MVNVAAGRGLVAFAYAVCPVRAVIGSTIDRLHCKPCLHGADWLASRNVDTCLPFLMLLTNPRNICDVAAVNTVLFLLQSKQSDLRRARYASSHSCVSGKSRLTRGVLPTTNIPVMSAIYTTAFDRHFPSRGPE